MPKPSLRKWSAILLLVAVSLVLGGAATGVLAKVGSHSAGSDGLVFLFLYPVGVVTCAVWVSVGEYFVPAAEQGGPSNRLTYRVMAWANIIAVAAMWFVYARTPSLANPSTAASWASGAYVLMPALAAGMTAAVCYLWFVRWRSRRTRPSGTSRKERIEPPVHYTAFAFWGDVLGTVLVAAIFLWAGSAGLSYTVRTWLDQHADVLPLPPALAAGRVLLIFAVLECSQILFGLLVSGHVLRALADGLRDYEVTRAGLFAFSALPSACLLLSGIWFPSVIPSALINLGVLLGMGVFTDVEPEVAFSRFKTASELRSRFAVHLRRPQPAADHAKPGSDNGIVDAHTRRGEELASRTDQPTSAPSNPET